MGKARTVKAARLEAHVAIATATKWPGAGDDLESDVRRVVPRWSEMLELVEGARKRGWNDEQLDYLMAVIGITWSKAFHRGEESSRAASRA